MPDIVLGTVPETTRNKGKVSALVRLTFWWGDPDNNYPHINITVIGNTGMGTE